MRWEVNPLLDFLWLISETVLNTVVLIRQSFSTVLNGWQRFALIFDWKCNWNWFSLFSGVTVRHSLFDVWWWHSNFTIAFHCFPLLSIAFQLPSIACIDIHAIQDTMRSHTHSHSHTVLANTKLQAMPFHAFYHYFLFTQSRYRFTWVQIPLQLKYRVVWWLPPTPLRGPELRYRTQQRLLLWHLALFGSIRC